MKELSRIGRHLAFNSTLYALIILGAHYEITFFNNLMYVVFPFLAVVCFLGGIAVDPAKLKTRGVSNGFDAIVDLGMVAMLAGYGYFGLATFKIIEFLGSRIVYDKIERFNQEASSESSTI